jgi:hypothetical protein
MKTIPAILLLTAFATGIGISRCHAQVPDLHPAPHMKQFVPWIGEWKGESLMYTGPGEPKKSAVHEVIGMKLDSTVLTLEGLGTANDRVVHHAFGLLNYDAITQQYKLRSYLKTGQMTDAWFNVLAPNQYQWGFDTPKGKVRYTITLDYQQGIWTEKGEFSPDGKTYYPYLDMRLKKVR